MLKFFYEEKPKIFSWMFFLSCVAGEIFIMYLSWDILSCAPISVKLPCPDKSLVHVCTTMAYLRIAHRKNWFIDSLVEHFKNIMKILHASIFSFIILNLLLKRGILDFNVTKATDICMKEVIYASFVVEHFESKLWKH